MTLSDLLVSTLIQNLGMLSMTVADFSEADMFVRPCPAANHATWMIGHLLVAEANIVDDIAPEKGAKISPALSAMFSKEMATIDDPKQFPAKSELLAHLNEVRQATITWAKEITEADLGKPGPAAMTAFIPTLGAALFILPGHLAMHVGQLQVIRRVLGKPIIM